MLLCVTKLWEVLYCFWKKKNKNSKVQYKELTLTEPETVAGGLGYELYLI